MSFLSTMSAIFSQSFSSVLSVFCIVWLIVFSISLQTSSIWFAHLAGCKDTTYLKTLQRNQLGLTKYDMFMFKYMYIYIWNASMSQTHPSSWSWLQKQTQKN